LPQEAQTAADQASVSRNTTDLRQAQLANAIAARRAGEAGPAADQARRAVENFRPTGQDELVGLLQKQATNAANTTFAPLRADTLRSFQRSGTAAGPVLAELGRTENASLRDSLIDAQIKGMTGVDQMNQNRRQGLEQSAANTAQLANPQFQYPGVAAGGDAGKALAALVAQRGQTSSVAPAYAMSGTNAAAGGVNTAYKGVTVPLPSNSLTEAGKTIGSALSNKDLLSNIETAYSGLFSPSVTKGNLTGYDFGADQARINREFQAQNGGFG
jgi:hypothetical protein